MEAHRADLEAFEADNTVFEAKRDAIESRIKAAAKDAKKGDLDSIAKMCIRDRQGAGCRGRHLVRTHQTVVEGEKRGAGTRNELV